jgi:pilus assembly protein Flp/PilA
MRFLVALALNLNSVTRDYLTAIEYGLIAALIAVFIITAVTAVGGGLEATFNAVADALTGAIP